MHTRKVRRYFIVPLIYVGIIFGLIYLQYSGTLTVRRTIGDMRFIGTLVAGEDETSLEITAARVEFEGIVFHFSQENPMVLRTDDGNVQELVPRSYSIEDQTLHVYFSDDSLVRFEVSTTQPIELHVIPTGTEDWPRDARVAVSWEVGSGTTLETPIAASPDVVDIRREDRAFFLSVPPQTRLDRDEGMLELPPSAGNRLIRYAERIDTETNVIETAFSGDQRRIGDGFFRDSVNRYLDLGFQGWASTRFNGGSGTWDMRDGSPRFSEQILTAYLAEAWRRDQYTTAYNQMRRAADQHPEQVGFLSAPFLGNLREVTDDFLAEDQQRALTLSTRITGGDPTVFRERDLIQFAALRGNEELFRNLITFIRSVDFREVGIKTAVGMFAAATAEHHPTEDSRDATRRFLAILEERIYPAIRQFDEYFFLETSQGEIDLEYSIRTGILLDRYGRRSGDILAVTVGRNLVLSALQLADNRGFLPRLLFVSDQGVERQEGSFGPEVLYAELSDNPWYPRKISLYDDLGAGSFIWTIANFTRVDIGTQQKTFSLEYPRNRTHYILMQGIPAFESMVLFNLQWRNDPTFELYIKGRHYEPRTETLMIKYTDNSVEGDITLFY